MNKQGLFSFATDPRLSSTACRVYAALRKLARGRPEVWHATATIAAAVRRCKRTVQLAIRELIAAGYVGRRRDHGLTSRRALVFLVPTDPGLSATGCADSAQPGCAQDPPPPAPPIEDVTGGLESVDGGGAGASPGAEPEPEPAPPPPSEVRASGQGARKATPEEVQGLKARADSTGVGWGWAKGQAKRLGLSWVARALGRVEEVQAEQPVRRPRGLAAAVLREWEQTGGPPEPPPSVADQQSAAFARLVAQFKEVQ